MTNEDYKRIFWQRDLFVDFDKWQKIAGGLVRELKEKNADMYYINQAEHFKATLHQIDGANLSDYAETVLRAVGQVDGWYNAEATPDNVKEVCNLFNKTVESWSPSAKLNYLLDAVKELKVDLRDAESTLRDVENEIDGIKDDLDNTKQEINDFIAEYKAAMNAEQQDDNSQKG